MMKKMTTVTAFLLLLAGSCSRSGNVQIADQADSLAYIIGMNVGENLMKMDSTLRVDAVCEGIRDVFGGAQRLTMEQARTYYLRYVTYEKPERVRVFEEQFLEDIRQTNRSFARTNSGLTYKIDEIGDEKQTPSHPKDTVTIRYVLRTSDGREIYSSYERRDTLRVPLSDLLPGMQEGLRLIGKGGRMEAWLPAATAYGVEGDKESGVGANATLQVEVELLDLSKGTLRPGTRLNF